MAARLLIALDQYQHRHHAVVVINCMPDLMRHTRMGKLDVAEIFGRGEAEQERPAKAKQPASKINGRALRLMSSAGSWIGRQARTRQHNGESGKRKHNHGAYLKLVDRVPALLRFVPSAGALRDGKEYLYLFCYFLQPTPANIRTMILFAVQHYVPDPRLNLCALSCPRRQRSP